MGHRIFTQQPGAGGIHDRRPGASACPGDRECRRLEVDRQWLRGGRGARHARDISSARKAIFAAREALIESLALAQSTGRAGWCRRSLKGWPSWQPPREQPSRLPGSLARRHRATPCLCRGRSIARPPTSASWRRHAAHSPPMHGQQHGQVDSGCRSSRRSKWQCGKRDSLAGDIESTTTSLVAPLRQEPCRTFVKPRAAFRRCSNLRCRSSLCGDQPGRPEPRGGNPLPSTGGGHVVRVRHRERA